MGAKGEETWRKTVSEINHPSNLVSTFMFVWLTKTTRLYCLSKFHSFIGRKEGTVNASSSYYILSRGQDGAFEALPVSNW